MALEMNKKWKNKHAFTGRKGSYTIMATVAQARIQISFLWRNVSVLFAADM